VQEGVEEGEDTVDEVGGVLPALLRRPRHRQVLLKAKGEVFSRGNARPDG